MRSDRLIHSPGIRRGSRGRRWGEAEGLNISYPVQSHEWVGADERTIEWNCCPVFKYY